MTEQICIRNGTALKLRNDVAEGKSGRGGEEEVEEEEARLVTARVDLASPSVFRDAIQQPDRIFAEMLTKRNVREVYPAPRHLERWWRVINLSNKQQGIQRIYGIA